MTRIVVLDGHTVNPGDNPWDELGNFGELVVYERTPWDYGRDPMAGEAAYLVLALRLGIDALRETPVQPSLARAFSSMDWAVPVGMRNRARVAAWLDAHAVSNRVAATSGMPSAEVT